MNQENNKEPFAFASVAESIDMSPAMLELHPK